VCATGEPPPLIPTDRIRFSPLILPPYLRRSKSIETLLPILYLKGISTGDFSEALSALLGKDAAGLSASAVGRLKDGWLDEHIAWQKRDLSAKRYVYIWADGIHLEARLNPNQFMVLGMHANNEALRLKKSSDTYTKAADRRKNATSGLAKLQ
jgi:transposase-like protein